MTEKDFREILEDRLRYGDEASEEFDNAKFRNFQDAGLMTRNEGLVITMEDGSKFQVTIVKVR